MPTINLEQQRREARRAYLKSLRVGSMVHCSAPGCFAVMSPGRPAETEAQRKSREWNAAFEKKHLSGW